MIVARGDERAATVNRDDEAFVSELSHGATHCHPGHAILMGQINLTRQPGIRYKPPSADVFLDVPGNLSSYRYGRIVPYPGRSVIQRHVDHAR